MGKLFEPWPASVVEGIANVLGETQDGLKGKEIGPLLASAKSPDENSSASKRDRINVALWNKQTKNHAANCVMTFVVNAMAPARYSKNPALFSQRQDDLNEVLVYVGLRVTDKGKLGSVRAATSLTEGLERAASLRSEMTRRRFHPAVMDSCSQEVLARNWFHASLEAVKSILQRLRDMTGKPGDGAALADTCLALGRDRQPLIAINSLDSESEESEQTGFATLVKGLSVMYRNPVAHDPRSKRTVSEEELLELLTTVSAVHRRLDSARGLPHVFGP